MRKSYNGESRARKIGMAISFERKKQDMCQEQLSDLSGIHRSSISRYENGRKTPSIESLSLIARALRVPFEKISGEDLI